MKKIIATVALLCITGLSFAATGSNKINRQARHAFGKEFVNAKNAVWQQGQNYSKVTFTLNNMVRFAYYDNNGALLGVIHNMLSDQLPVTLLTEIKKNYCNYWISDLFEISVAGQTAYYITLENGDETLVLESADSRNWAVYERKEKSYSIQF